jgi:diguanylate cyclase (GGDEF)-like protein/PAS domain S-box-containing protein
MGKEKDSEANDTGTRDHRVVHALAVAGLLVLGITIVIAAVLVTSYRDTIEREETNLHNLATAFAAETHQSMRAIELILAGGEHAWRRGLPFQQMPAEADYLAHESGAAEHLQGIYLYDAVGKLVAQRAGDPATKPPAPTRERLHIGISDIEPRTGRASINVGRTVLDTSGHHAGSLVGQAGSAYFQQNFHLSNLGPGGSVTLLHRDGTMLARSPALAGAIGRSFLRTPLFQRYLPVAPHGAYGTISPVDGRARLYGYSSVERYPLVIIAGRDKSDTLRVWYEWLGTAVAFWLLATVTLLLLALRVGREAARLDALVGRLAASESRLSQGSRYLKAIIDALPTPLWVLDAARRIVMCNEAFSRFAGRPSLDLIGQEEAGVLDSERAQAREQLYREVLDGAGIKAVEAELRDGAGQARTVIQQAARLDGDNAGVPLEVVNTLTDISERKQAELRLAYLAEFDLLTELPNQAQLRTVLERAIAEAGAKSERLALVIVALERLQEIEELLGHEAGDDALRQLGALLRKQAPPSLCVARIKHSEFALVLPMKPDDPPLDEYVVELERLLSEPVSLQQREFYLEPMVGIALYPQDSCSVNELLRLADIAKHRAGAGGTDPIQFYSERTHMILNERLNMEEQLRRALERGELRLVYQPKVDIASGLITGLEALMRWNNPTLGEVAPSQFVPIAERTGMIVAIGAWVQHTACVACAHWRAELGEPVKVAVNLSMRQFYQKDLIRGVRRALDDTGLEPALLELEITETIAMSRAELVDKLLSDIRELGVELSIDDFGTGYSSLAYLKRFPVQRLKIDRAFVRDLGRDADSAAIIRSIVALGHGLQMRIVAEGVETAAQLALLRELGCDEYQGFLFSRPVEAEAVPALLRANRAAARHGPDGDADADAVARL